jgi:hypothetical protein
MGKRSRVEPSRRREVRPTPEFRAGAVIGEALAADLAVVMGRWKARLSELEPLTARQVQHEMANALRAMADTIDPAKR